jgi:chromosome partitioning protein
MIFTVMNQKGGVGKTTTSVMLSALAANSGRRVLLVDLDSQANCSDALGVDSAPALYDVLVDEKPLDELIIEARPNLFLLRSDKTTLLAENIIKGRDYSEYALANALENYDFDLVILDCAPSARVLHTGALVAADYLIIPTELATFSVKGIMEIERTLKSARKMTTSNCQLAGILPTKLHRSNSEYRAQRANLEEIYGAIVWPPIPVDAKIDVAHRKGLTLMEYAPRSPALIGRKEGRKYVGGYHQAFERLIELVR